MEETYKQMVEIKTWLEAILARVLLKPFSETLGNRQVVRRVRFIAYERLELSAIS
ncbi:MAG: hypothetical protein R3C28_31765 [Pirellulaceae bacterium]